MGGMVFVGGFVEIGRGSDWFERFEVMREKWLVWDGKGELGGGFGDRLLKRRFVEGGGGV